MSSFPAPYAGVPGIEGAALRPRLASHCLPASPSAQRLALGTASLELRLALIGAGVCVAERPDGPACELAQLGSALVEPLEPPSAGQREQISREVGELLGV